MLSCCLIVGKKEGQPRTCTIFRRCFISFAYHTLSKPVSYFDAPGDDPKKPQTIGAKAMLILN